MKVMAIAGTSLRIMFRDRTTIFFVFVLPLMLILVLGAAFGGGDDPRLGVVPGTGGPLTARMTDELRKVPHLRVEAVKDEAALTRAVERGSLQGGLVFPADYDAAVTSGKATLRFIARRDLNGLQLGVAVRGAVARQSERLRAARFAVEQGHDFIEGLAAADAAALQIPDVGVETVSAGESALPADLGRFDLGASQELVLFVFLTSLTGSSALITARRLGLSRRMLATPTPVRTILAGEAIGRMSLALLQGLLIMVGSSMLFGVAWGDPAAALAILVALCLAGSGAAMVTGSVLRTEQQAGAIGILLGLGFAALGGSMTPLEFFSPTLRIIARFTPHAWANEAFEKILHDAGPADILPQLGVLLGYALVLFAAGTWLLRRSLITGVR